MKTVVLAVITIISAITFAGIGTVEKETGHALWNTLLQKHVSQDGKVNYKGFLNDRESIENYIYWLSTNVPQESDSKSVVLAYWINAYNALTVDLIVKNYPVKSIKDIPRPWKQKLWTLDGRTYNLDEIEHQILRKTGEARIHFAINCASISCPKLRNRAYVPDKLESQLHEATLEFLRDETKNVISSDKLEISKIFQWFKQDFKSYGGVVDFIGSVSGVDIKPNVEIRYNKYDWNLNE